jgi:hypothetical protein
MVWVSIIVFFLSIFCFLIIKVSIDQANSSRTELNKMKDAQERQITEKISTNSSFIVANRFQDI